MRASAAEQEMKRLKVKIEKMAILNGVNVDEPLHQDLCGIKIKLTSQRVHLEGCSETTNDGFSSDRFKTNEMATNND